MTEGWITINGTHIYVKDGESTEEAFARTTGKELNNNSQINANLRETINEKKYSDDPILRWAEMAAEKEEEREKEIAQLTLKLDSFDKEEVAKDKEFVREQNIQGNGFEWKNTPEMNFYLANKYGLEKATKDTFFENSIGYWELQDKKPRGKPDYISRYYNKSKGKMDTSSEYWYTKEGVYRRSDHWGSDIASCSWYIKGRKYKSDGIKKSYEKEVAFIKWEDLKPKGLIANNNKLIRFTFSK